MKEPTKKEAREWLKGLFEKYRRVPQLQKRTFQDLYPNIEAEKTLPATTELTRSEIGKLAFPLSARTCFEATKKWHNHELYMRMGTVKSTRVEASDNAAASDGDDHDGPPRRLRVVNLDGGGNMATSEHASSPFMLHWISQMFGRVQAFKNQYLALSRVVYENSTPEEREELDARLDNLATEFEDVALAIRNFRKSRAVRAGKRVAKTTPGQRQQAENSAVL